MTGALKSRAVKVVDKEREGSKSVIVKRKEFSKREAEDSRENAGCKDFFLFFLHLAVMLH